MNIMAERLRQIAVVLTPNFNAFATMAFLDPFRAANYLRGPDLSEDAGYEWTFVNHDAEATGEEITASNGLVVKTEHLSDIAGTRFDAIVISASWAPEKYQNPTLFSWLRRHARHGTKLGGIDTGAFILGFAGLLDGYSATTHYEHMAAFEELFPAVETSPSLYVIDRDRFTTCGGIASTDLALALMQDVEGANLTNAAARYIFKSLFRPPDAPQVPTIHEPIGFEPPSKLKKAIKCIEDAFPDKVPADQLAKESGLSPRQMQRMFIKYTGVSPVRYAQDMRLDRARGMITQTDLSILEIATACGFSSPEYMAKCYRDRFHVAPSKDRQAGRIPFQFRQNPMYGARLTGDPKS